MGPTGSTRQATEVLSSTGPVMTWVRLAGDAALPFQWGLQLPPQDWAQPGGALAALLTASIIKCFARARLSIVLYWIASLQSDHALQFSALIVADSSRLVAVDRLLAAITRSAVQCTDGR